MDYADWKAPKADKDRLIWPPPDDWAAMVRDNHRSLGEARGAIIQGLPLSELRAATRAYVGLSPDALAIITGHQSELWHPGVWAKNALIDAASRAISGVAVHLTVDTDAPKHLNIRWPGYSAPISDDPRLGEMPWTGAVAPPTPAHLASIESALTAATPSFGYEPALGEWLADVRRSAFDVENGASLPKVVAQASHRLDWSLGLDYQLQTLSPWLGSAPWLTFVHHVMANARAFAVDYNAALRDYRVEAGIESTSRPIPDLAIADDSIEIPFWLDEDCDEPRRHRATVRRQGDQFELSTPAGDSTFIFNPDAPAADAANGLAMFLRRHRLRVGPRALTLTLFVRLFVADVFVHGIGGGRYDQVTDRLIRSHFGIEPPRFGVTTATLYLPQALSRERACVPCIIHQGHRLRHNLLGSRKRELVAAIAALPRQSPERAQLFATMSRERRSAEASDSRLADWRHLLDETKRREADDATVFDREVFYAAQPIERLKNVIDGYRAAWGS